ncbi:zinc finger protein 676-like [Bombus flavifrons]|uniref:zinc finger protein 676-like n=1 Tax=Bombus flavifrons TaxID=103934 RepID=UPI00370393EB
MMHTCEWCGRPFSWPSSLRLHQRMACGKPPNFCCTICDYKSNFKGNLKRHLLYSVATFKIREGIGERMELLDVTDVYVATARINLENESVKGYTDDCVVTEETCEDEDDDEMESMEYATGGLKEDRQEYKYSCFKCLKSYKRKGHLVEHQKIFCGKDKQQCCPYCSFRTYKKSNLKKHVSRELVLWEEYQVFEPTVTEASELRSERCSYEANYFGSGRKSTRICRNKSTDPLGGRYKCSKCSKSYRWKHHLVEHVKASCGQKKAECCPYCSYRSNRKWNLKSHMKRIHTDI